MEDDKPKKKRGWIKWVIIAVVVLVLLSLVSGGREVRISEAELNAKLAEELNQPVENPLVGATIDLRDGVGELTLTWEKGQTLRADIVTSNNKKRLLATDVDITGVGILDKLFEGGANIVLNQVLAQISVSQRNLSEIEILEDELVGYYGKRR